MYLVMRIDPPAEEVKMGSESNFWTFHRLLLPKKSFQSRLCYLCCVYILVSANLKLFSSDFTDLAAEDGLLSGPPFALFKDILCRRER